MLLIQNGEPSEVCQTEALGESEFMITVFGWKPQNPMQEARLTLHPGKARVS